MSSTKTQYPLGTVAVYGPTDKLATKLVASVFPTARLELNAIRKWTTNQGDIRENAAIRDELSAFLKENNVAHAVVTEEILGCPHEEGVDYPVGTVCPHCPFWAKRPRFAQRTPTPKSVGRNDPCPCGSGKKHKKCCGA